MLAARWARPPQTDLSGQPSSNMQIMKPKIIDKVALGLAAWAAILVGASAPGVALAAPGDRLEPGLQGQSMVADNPGSVLPRPYSKGVRVIGHDPIGGRDREGVRVVADFGVDVTQTFAVKRAMLAAHESQQSWVARQHDIPDQLASMEAWTRRRGKDFGVAMAEGFRQYRHHPYPRTPALQDLLGIPLVEQ